MFARSFTPKCLRVHLVSREFTRAIIGVVAFIRVIVGSLGPMGRLIHSGSRGFTRLHLRGSCLFALALLAVLRFIRICVSSLWRPRFH